MDAFSGIHYNHGIVYSFHSFMLRYMTDKHEKQLAKEYDLWDEVLNDLKKTNSRIARIIMLRDKYKISKRKKP